MSDAEITSNRKAYHRFTILDTLEAGITLLGSEVKSLRSHGCSIQEAYITHKKGELWLIHCTIPLYSHSSYFTHEEKRERKLLIHKKELVRLQKMIQEKGLTLIPLSLYWKKNKVKVKIGCAKGKKMFDKRASIKEREEKRTIERAKREKNRS